MHVFFIQLELCITFSPFFSLSSPSWVYSHIFPNRLKNNSLFLILILIIAYMHKYISIICWVHFQLQGWQLCLLMDNQWGISSLFPSSHSMARICSLLVGLHDFFPFNYEHVFWDCYFNGLFNTAVSRKIVLL